VLTAGPLIYVLVTALQVASITIGVHMDAETRVRGINLPLEDAPGLEDQASPRTHSGNGYGCDETAVDRANQYNGRVFDSGTGFHDYGARMYWPEIGRFISPDTYQGDIANPASLNRYSYVLNNPYKYTDPTGHMAFVIPALYVAGAELSLWCMSGGCQRAATVIGALFDLVDQAGMQSANVPPANADGAVPGREAGGEAVAATPVLMGKGANHLQPDTNADGAHSTWKTDDQGRVTGHAEWMPNPQHPEGFEQGKRVDTQHANKHTHRNKKTGQDVPTPHAHDKSAPGGVRPATKDELPK